MEQTLLIVVSAIFALSLFGAYVLFRFLKSTAIIKRTGYQAGGALAGFLLIFGALYASYSQLEKNAMARIAQPKLWTIVGEVNLENDTLNNAEVEVTLLPPSPKTLSASGGEFRFDDVGIENDDLVELQFELDGYHTESMLLTQESAEIDSVANRITLKQPVRLLQARSGASNLPTNASLPAIRLPAGVAGTTISATDPGTPPTRGNTGTLSGRVLKSVRTRSPLSSARVDLLKPGGSEAVYSTFSDTDGRYSLRGIAAGDYEIRVRLGAQELEVISPQSRAMTLAPAAQKQLIITVTTQTRG